MIGEELGYLPLLCEFLDPETRLCTVYERRHETNPGCLTVEEGIELGVFPADCPYVRGRVGYHPPREQCAEQELKLYFKLRGNDGEQPPQAERSARRNTAGFRRAAPPPGQP